MIQAAQDAIARIAAADHKAQRSQLAFTLGPDTYLDYWNQSGDDARKRLEDAYRKLSDESAGAVTDRVDATAGSVTG